MNRQVILDVVTRLPQGALSRAWGWTARRKRPRLAIAALKRVFVRAVGADMSEALESVDAYPTLEDLFVRRLRPGARRVDPDPEAVVSPVDAVCGASGAIRDGLALQVKGRSYSVASLLGSPGAAERFEGGSYATYYLSPRDYHRVHSPVSGNVAEGMLLPGALLPVFPEAVENVDELFARNERLVTYVDTEDAGRVAVVKVGATLVGRITVTYDPTLATNIVGQEKRLLRYQPPRDLAKGAELGAFEMGSTVVLLTEPGAIELDPCPSGTPVRMGQRIGSITARKKTRRRSQSGGGSRKKSSGQEQEAQS